jgi:hypothetical protein
MLDRKFVQARDEALTELAGIDDDGERRNIALGILCAALVSMASEMGEPAFSKIMEILHESIPNARRAVH